MRGFRTIAVWTLTAATLVAGVVVQAASPRRLDDWSLRSAAELTIGGEVLSTAAYEPTGWYTTHVPSTVLNTLVEAGVYPDPRVAMNNFEIPDASEAFNERLGLSRFSYLADGSNPWTRPYWYRTTFELPAAWRQQAHIWLTLHGINYRANVWVNGRKVADREEVVGMFRRFRFDITEVVDRTGKNCIALEVFLPDHPGTPNPGTQFRLFGPNRGTAGDLFRDETLKFTGGWDCAPVIRDRNMGLWHPVTLEATGEVVISNPYVTTVLPKRDTTRADLTVEATLKNHADKPMQGTLRARISHKEEVDLYSRTRTMPGTMNPVEVAMPIRLEAGEERTVRFTPEAYAALCLRNPLLWWPNGHGAQHLHTLELTFEDNHGTQHDKACTDFGIREVKSELLKRGDEHGLVFRVNGRRIFCKGGWLQPDALLANSVKNIYDQARLLAEAHINLVGSEDMPSPREEWVESWDKYGLMNWHVFYQCYRMFPGRDNQHNPDNNDLALACVKDMVLRYRNHPSIIAWFGVNEVCVDEELYGPTRDTVLRYDHARPYIPTTSVSWDVDKLTPYLREALPTGTTDDGAPDYNWAPSEYYFQKVNEVHLQMFRNELGMPAMPTYESLRRFIPSVERHSDGRDPLFPLDSVWAEHGAWDANNFCYRAYDNAIRTFYSDPKDGRDYVRKGQIVSAEGYRAMYEAANHRMWDITTGVMLWKLNACWPDVCWQIYDWYLAPNASYYFARQALSPVHVQMNADTQRVTIINNSPEPLKGVRVSAEIIDIANRRPWQMQRRVNVKADSYQECFDVPRRGDLSAVYFIRLRLEDATGQCLSENLYWRYSQHQNFYWLVSLEPVEIIKSVKTDRRGREREIVVEVENTTDRPSFFNHLLVRRRTSGEVVNPVFWEDNFITLFPGERRTLRAVVAEEDLAGEEPEVVIG